MVYPIFLFLAQAALASPFSGTLGEPAFELYTAKEHPEPGSTQFWWKLIISMVLVLAGGVFAGCVCDQETM